MTMAQRGDGEGGLDWLRLRAEIEALLEDTKAEIRAYPTPIPACDVQFNHLLELRQGLPGELSRLDAAARAGGAKPRDFLAESPFRDALARRGLR